MDRAVEWAPTGVVDDIDLRVRILSGLLALFCSFPAVPRFVFVRQSKREVESALLDLKPALRRDDPLLDPNRLTMLGTGFSREGGIAIAMFALGSMVLAAVVLVTSNPKLLRAALIQGAAPLLGLVFLVLSLVA